ncbi:ABC transporter substrate-binding protein [Massilia niastensis]|uniref:ABC transporter substrate-binding protein n=1 Tax=Massilia niastensis TaxID=544911 RepID=UPI000371422F|nr:extracellular solute-binding protein [Massilia niastensis]
MRLFSLAFLALALAAPLAHATDPAAVAAIAQYEGADRTQRLIEGARREGSLTLYTSLTVEDMAVINAAFEKKYGVKVKMWRAGADKVLQRMVTEARGNRFDVDVAEASTPALESLRREKLLAAVRSPHHADLMAQAVPAHREWVGSRMNVFVHAYNTSQIRKEDAPASYQDLLDPKWKGRLGIESADEDWFATVVSELGEEKGLKLFRDISATNGISVRKGHTLLTNLVASGEVPFALTVYNFTAEQLREKGAPVAWYVMQPAVARVNGLAVAARAPHPHAAVLYYEFMISDEGQQILARRDFVTTSTRLPSPLGKTPLRLVDAALMLDENEKWTRLYEEIIVKPKK